MLSVNELVWHSSISQLDWWTLFEKNQISKISFWCRVIQEPLVQWLHITFPRIYTKSLSYREPQSIQTTRVNTVHFKTINVKHKYFETFKNIFPSERDTLNKISIIPVEQVLSGLINPGKSHENISVPDLSKELIIKIISNSLHVRII